MKAFNIIPQSQIASYVDRILVLENNSVSSPFVLPLYANGAPSLLFTSIKGRLGNNNRNHLTLFGQTITADSLTLYDNFTLIAYFLKPYALISLFKTQAHEVTDQPIDIHLLSPQKTKSLEDNLLHCKTVDAMIVALNHYIMELIKSSTDISDSISYVSEMISNDYSKASLINIQKDLKISERTLQRMFETNVGVSPNMFRRICQFNAAFTDLNLRHFTHLSDIAYTFGYADQSHYIRTFKEFTKLTPKAYLNYGDH